MKNKKLSALNILHIVTYSRPCDKMPMPMHDRSIFKKQKNNCLLKVHKESQFFMEFLRYFYLVKLDCLGTTLRNCDLKKRGKKISWNQKSSCQKWNDQILEWSNVFLPGTLYKNQLTFQQSSLSPMEYQYSNCLWVMPNFSLKKFTGPGHGPNRIMLSNN